MTHPLSSEAAQPNDPQLSPEVIIGAARRCITTDGVAATNLLHIAEVAGVSKSLILYHFHDRDTLLARVVDDLARRITARESRATSGPSDVLATDRLWRWLSDELSRGEIRALLDLSFSTSPALESVIAQAARVRHQSSQAAVERLFAGLALTPRVPASMLADVTVAFVDGLALRTPAMEEARVAFDVFWLAMLGLGE